MIYLDSAATTLQKPLSVSKRMKWAVNHLASPGRGGHPAAMLAADTAFSCREKAADLFHVPNPENIVFTLNATHSLNIAMQTLAKPGERVVISGYEHNSVVRPLKDIGAKVDVAASELFEPEVAVSTFDRKITANTSLVVVNHVSNVFGYVLPIEKIADICRERGVPFVLDASQSAGVLDVDFARLGAAFIAMPGHKGLYGPQGSGLLICGDGSQKPVLFGGTGSNSISWEMPDFLPDRLEAGTHDMPGIAGLLEGINFVSGVGLKRIEEHEKKLVKIMTEGFQSMLGAKVYASPYQYCQVGVVSFNLKNISPEIVGEKLAKRGIAVRAGLHCSPLAHETAGTLPSGTVRASVSAFSRPRDVYALLNACEDIIRKS